MRSIISIIHRAPSKTLFRRIPQCQSMGILQDLNKQDLALTLTANVLSSPLSLLKMVTLPKFLFYYIFNKNVCTKKFSNLVSGKLDNPVCYTSIFQRPIFIKIATETNFSLSLQCHRYLPASLSWEKCDLYLRQNMSLNFLSFHILFSVEISESNAISPYLSE